MINTTIMNSIIHIGYKLMSSAIENQCVDAIETYCKLIFHFLFSNVPAASTPPRAAASIFELAGSRFKLSQVLTPLKVYKLCTKLYLKTVWNSPLLGCDNDLGVSTLNEY